MIEVKSISKKFEDNEVLSDINSRFERGKTNLIIGQSGSGKTVFLKCLLGLYNIDSGEIKYDGRSSSEMNDFDKLNLRRDMGMVFQGSALFDSLNVLENVRFPLDMLTDIDSEEKNERALKFIKRVNLEDALNKLPSELSGGMQKRVAIARAICGNPKILLFDEPTSGLDPVTGSLIDQLIKTAVKTIGGSAITITHDMASVCRIADKVILIDKQTISWTGTPKEMFNSANKKIQEFIKPINSEIFFK